MSAYTYRPVEIGLERLTYSGTEEGQITEEICAVILANPMEFVGGTLQGTFTNAGITTIAVTIAPEQISGPNAATGIYIYIICNRTEQNLYTMSCSVFDLFFSNFRFQCATNGCVLVSK